MKASPTLKDTKSERQRVLERPENSGKLEAAPAHQAARSEPGVTGAKTSCLGGKRNDNLLLLL